MDQSPKYEKWKYKTLKSQGQKLQHIAFDEAFLDTTVEAQVRKGKTQTANFREINTQQRYTTKKISTK